MNLRAFWGLILVWSASIALALYCERRAINSIPQQRRCTHLQVIPGAIPEPTSRSAFVQQTPHSGRHFVPSHPAYRRSSWARRRRKRFMEGWYYRLTIPPDDNWNLTNAASFAIIISIEDPGNEQSSLRLACVQIVGPDYGYLVQAHQDDTRFWAWQHQQGLGYVFDWIASRHQNEGVLLSDNDKMCTTALDNATWHANVRSGFQILPHHLLGRIQGHDGTMGGVLAGQGMPGTCEFNFTIQPICGWGDFDLRPQKRTGGWLSRYAVFEPHWQVTLADARASGTITWHNQTYEFDNAPFYAEKNWGAALPPKWYWTQCNYFPGYAQLSVTAGGGVRLIPIGRRETLGMVCVHYNGRLYEGVPWTGTMSWNISTWGTWTLWGRATFTNRPFEVMVSYTVDPAVDPGLVFRAPTPDEGMVYFCRDTFEAATTLTLWELEWDSVHRDFVRKAGPPLIDHAKSPAGGAEIGGGPWWSDWNRTSLVKQPIRALLRLPLHLHYARRKIQAFVARQTK